MILKGKLVALRPITIKDAEITFRWRQEERAIFLQRGAQTVKEQRTWILSRDKASELNFIIECQRVTVGMIALLDIDQRNKKAVLGRLLIGEKEKVGRKPVFFETELLLFDYAFDQLRLHKIQGEVMEDNITMIRSRLYLGYRQDGILRDHYIFEGVYKNAILFSLLEKDYRDICRPKLVKFIGVFSKFA
jgi:RimJ/RimL family protein N-acetyltransferase